MSSGSRGCLKAWKSSLGRGKADTIPVIKGLKPGDKVAAAGGFLIDAETRLNPAAAATYFGASGGPQSNGRPSVPSVPSPRQAIRPRSIKSKPDQAPAASRPPEPSGSQVAVALQARTTSRTSNNCPRPTGNWHSRSGFALSRALRWARWACRSRSPSAARRSSCAAKGASARPSEAPTKC